MTFPLAPPRDWFEQPEPNGPEPLTVEADGRVHGHLADWNACHIGFTSGQMAECVKPPRSMNDYRSFHVGSIETDDGQMISVGRLVTAGGHASLVASMEQAQRHYDNSQAVGAFVRARDGRHGIYFAGAVRSDATPEVIRDMRANPPSGDWRRSTPTSPLELIAALSVPVPGYQTPQLALTASGEVGTLILPGYFEEEEMAYTARGKGYVRRKRMIQKSLVAAPLTAKRRNALSARDFALPGTRQYPIYDRSHAANALARSSGKPEEAQVRRAVCRRYPDLGECAK